MNKLRTVAAINDISGSSRCSLTVALPVLAAMGMQCCVMPTAILSNHTGYSSYFFEDYTSNMSEFIKNWRKQNLKFDCIYSGFLGSEKQIHIISDMADYFKTPLLIDPVMGDNGKIYVTYTKKMCEDMRHLCEKADIITPNMTEACILSDMEYKGEDVPLSYGEEILKVLSEKLPATKHIVITGIKHNGITHNAVFDSGVIRFTENKLCDCYFDGTGDVFASIVCGCYLSGDSFFDCVKTAGDFIEKSAFYSKEMNASRKDGIILSKYICDLKRD